MSDDLTPEAVRALLDNATPGPWDDVRPVWAAPGTRLLLAPWTTSGGGEHRPHVMNEHAWRRIADGNRALIAAAPDLAHALLAAWRERDDALIGVEPGKRAASTCAEVTRDLVDIGRLCDVQDDEWPHYAVQRVVRERDEARAEVKRLRAALVSQAAVITDQAAWLASMRGACAMRGACFASNSPNRGEE